MDLAEHLLQKFERESEIESKPKALILADIFIMKVILKK